MRIAMVSTPFLATPPKTYGGTELVVHELTEGLVERGHEVLLFATGDSTTRAELHALYPVAQWPPAMLPDVNHVAWSVREAAARGCEVIHVHSAAALALSRFVPDVPFVYTLHHVREEELSAFYRRFAAPWYVAISADQLSREVPLARTAVIHHGVDPDRYAWTARPADYVAFVGRMAPEKAPHVAIDVAGRAGVEIRVAGAIHPADREYGEREVTRRLSLPHVRYLGEVGAEVKRPLLRDARALLAPIDWNEPFGLILIEAMLSGCPVVAFPRGSVPELVEPGVTGFVVGSPEEMEAAIRPGGAVDGFDRARCRARAVERFGRARMVEDHERLYRAALAAPPTERPAARAA